MCTRHGLEHCGRNIQINNTPNKPNSINSSLVSKFIHNYPYSLNFMMISAQSMQKSTPVPIQKPTIFTCLCCKVRFELAESQRSHFKSEWHKYNLKRKVCNLTTIDLQSFELIQASIPEKKEVITKEKIRHASKPTKPVAGGSDNRLTDSEIYDDDECDPDDEDGWDDVEDEEDEEEVARMLSQVVKPNHCLFCYKQSSDIDRNLNHMNRVHGFFIPEEKYLIDLDGLMEYLGFKVGAGATCLWCNKEFSTLQGVRLHMIYRDHCKIMYEQDKAIDEFKEFYDYSSQEKFEMKRKNQLAIPRRAPEREPWKTRQYQMGSDRSSRGSKQLVATTARSHANSRELIARSGLSFMVEPKLAKNYKKFAAVRAKKFLKIGMGNNNTMRSRIRLQNPM